jgi:hypothetical protein
MSTYAGSDDCTDIVLDFIAGGYWGDQLGNPVGESDGNYNAYFGHVDSTVDLCGMMLAEIYRFQDDMLEDDPRSTAAGRYQFLKGTLQNLQRQNQLSSTELFAEELQDRLAVDLLVGRGYSRWWTGDLSDEDFAHNISMEWASLPDPFNDGKSHYDGDAVGNHASTTLDCVYEMLRRARAEITDHDGPEPPALRLSATDAIKAIQAILVRRGLLHGRDDIDGIWGPQSQAALDELAAQATALQGRARG